MKVSREKVRQLWLPFFVMIVIVLVASWLLPGVIYPNDIRAGGEGFPLTDDLNVSLTSVIDPKTSETYVAKLLPPDAEETNDLVSTGILNCTYTRHYWRENPHSWMVENVVIANLSFTKSQALVILSNEIQPGADDAEKDRLLQEFFAALLNVLKGANGKAIEVTLTEANDWLNAHAAVVNLSPTELDREQELVRALSDFNNGLTGPPPCSDEPLTPSPSPSQTQTVTRTATSLPIAAGAASLTPTKTPGGGGDPASTPTSIVIPPTADNYPTATSEPVPPIATPSPSPEPTTPANTQPATPEPSPTVDTNTPPPDSTEPASTPTPPPPTATLIPSNTPLSEPTNTPVPPLPPTATEPALECSNAYPDFCIPPPPPDLDCGDISKKNFTVLPPDPHNFDSDGDGIGCEG